VRGSNLHALFICLTKYYIYGTIYTLLISAWSAQNLYMNYTLTFKSLIAAVLFAALIPHVSLAETTATLTATTMPATNITETGAQLNGYAALAPWEKTTVWFEWGETLAFGEQTQSETYWDEYNESKNLTGLKKGTRYYYRIAVIGKGETRYGETLSFTTKSAPVVSTATQNSNTPSAVGSTQTATAAKTSSTASSKTTTTKTTAVSTDKDDDCATTTASVSAGALTANAAQSDGGVGGLTIFLILVAIALAIAAAFMNISAAHEASRRKREEGGMVIA